MYEEMTPELIKTNILAGLKTDIDKREGGFADDMAAPLALELYKMYGALRAIQPMVWVDQTSGIYLDLAAKELGLEPRKDGTPSNVTLLVTGEEGTHIAPETTFLTRDGQYFTTLTDSLISNNGTVEIAAVSRKIGSICNVIAKSITMQFQSVPGIHSVTNPLAAVGGTDAESDDSLYRRIVSERRYPGASGNIYDYEKWAVATDGVGFVKVLPLWNGNGTVKIIIANEFGLPVDAQIVRRCAEHIEKLRPIGAAVTVESAKEVRIDVTAAVSLKVGSTLDGVSTSFRKRIANYLSSVGFSENSVLYNRVGSLLIETDGVRNYAELQLNRSQADIQTQPGEVPVVGVVTISEAV